MQGTQQERASTEPTARARAPPKTIVAIRTVPSLRKVRGQARRRADDLRPNRWAKGERMSLIAAPSPTAPRGPGGGLPAALGDIIVIRAVDPTTRAGEDWRPGGR